MSAPAGRTAGKVGQAIKGAAIKANNVANEAGTGKGNQGVLQKGAKRDPELYVNLPSFDLEANPFVNIDPRSSLLS